MEHSSSPTGKIAPQPWMSAPETMAVIDALRAGGAAVRFVGGCVRDAVARHPVTDIDIATPEPPETVMALLEAAGIKAVPTGIGHGTITAVVAHKAFEITTLRVDVETDGRHAKVAFTDDWTADAARRDFTINALSCTPEGDIYDPFGGLEDLGHGRVRFVGDPRQRIEEDVLRLLRFFRMYGAYGQPPPDAAALAACREMVEHLAGLSGERVCHEVFRILMDPDPADVVTLMRGEGVLARILPEAGDVGRLRVVSWLETRAIRVASIGPDPLRRLAALLDPAGGQEAAQAVATRLRLSNRQRDRLATLAARPFAATPESSAQERHRALQHLGAGIVRDLALLAWAGERAVEPHQPPARTHAWLALIADADGWTPRRFPLRGRDVTALGVPEGSRVGELLAAVELWWEEGDYQADRAACLDRLRELAGRPGTAHG